MTEGETIDWPIYSLADYDGAGILLERCKFALSGENCDSATNTGLETTTSGYQSQIKNSTPTDRLAQSKADKKVETHKGESQLRWWQLVEREQRLENGRKRKVEKVYYKQQIVQLCLFVYKLVGGYLNTGNHQRTLKGMILSPRQLQLSEHLSTKQTAGEDRSEPIVAADGSNTASLRRLSWRRRVLAKVCRERRNSAIEPANTINSINSTLLGSWLQDESSLKTPVGVGWSKLRQHRGRYGESLVHILIVNGSNEHLILLVILIHLWPALANDVFQSSKFNGLSCLHLAIAYSNERLLHHLLSVGSVNVEQRVTGSLFSSPLPSTKTHEDNGRCVKFLRNKQNRRQVSVSSFDDAPQAYYWCDQTKHWPTANGSAHLILYDKLLARAAQNPNTEVSNHATPSNGDDNEINGNDVRQSTIYLGERPLDWTVSFKSRAMYELLVDAGAKQDGRDAGGNSCLHLVVINDQPGWSRFLVKCGFNIELTNAEGLTPLLLTCHLGRYKLFEELLELSAVEFWSYSMIRCCGYPLAGLDSILPVKSSSTVAATTGDNSPALGSVANNNGLKEMSAMSVILESRESDDEQKARLLLSAVVKKLLEEKWHIFAKRLFYNELLLSMAHLLLMTLGITLRSANGDDKNQQQQTTVTGSFWMSLWLDRQRMIRHISELLTLVLSVRQLISFVREWRRDSNISLQWTYNPLLPNLVLANALVLVCAIVRLIGCLPVGSPFVPALLATNGRSTEDVLLIFAAPLLWSSLLFFIAAFRVTGPFVIMIRYMVVRDLRQFSLIYLVFLHAFAQCIFFVNYKQQQASPIMHDKQEGENNLLQLDKLMSSYIELWMDLFKMTLGVYDLQPYRHSSLARLFFLLFIYLIPILFNMLIAMMNNTYSLIISQSERAWSFQWARTLFALERRLEPAERLVYLRRYSINMATDEAQSDKSPPADEKQSVGAKEKRFVPALMIIKRMSFTRAERRRLVVGYWQTAIRQTLSKRTETATC